MANSRAPFPVRDDFWKARKDRMEASQIEKKVSTLLPEEIGWDEINYFYIFRNK